MILSSGGQIVNKIWHQIPEHFLNVSLDSFAIMPDHIHGVLCIDCRSTAPFQPNGAAGLSARPALGQAACRAPTNHMGCRRNSNRKQSHEPRAREQFGYPVSGSLATVIRSFKSAVTKCINETNGMHGINIWQRNYYDRILENETELSQIREYVQDNPRNWAHKENPNGH